MKYGETTFDILYLLFAVISGCVILKRARNQTEKRMGLAALILGCGDAFHLVPRMLNYFVSADFTAALGLGKLVTSITMTLFYLLLFYIWLGYYHEAKNQSAARFVWVCTVLRVVLCLFPQNGWLQNSSDMTWGIIRNVPFVMLGAAVCILYFRKRAERRRFKPLWVYILLSFLFYIPVAVGAGAVPILGMLMLPKTICYVFLVYSFLQAVIKDPEV